MFTFIALFMIFCGLFCTLMPNVPGTLIIFLTLGTYSYFHHFANLSRSEGVVLAFLVILADVICPMLRRYFRKKYPLSELFGIESLIGNIGGMVVSSLLLGPVFGQVVWQVIYGKTWLTKRKWTSRVIARVLIVPFVRFGIGTAMAIFGLFNVLE